MESGAYASRVESRESRVRKMRISREDANSRKKVLGLSCSSGFQSYLFVWGGCSHPPMLAKGIVRCFRSHGSA